MVTIDKIVENVGKFNGNVIVSSKSYEKAKANVELIKNDPGKLKLEESLKKSTGFDDFNLPWESNEYNISLGGVTFQVKSIATTKRPSYNTAVDQMENYLQGINFMVNEEHKAITGVAKEKELWCIRVESLLENYRADDKIF
jgi:hypothetical protein